MNIDDEISKSIIGLVKVVNNVTNTFETICRDVTSFNIILKKHFENQERMNFHISMLYFLSLVNISLVTCLIFHNTT